MALTRELMRPTPRLNEFRVQDYLIHFWAAYLNSGFWRLFYYVELFLCIETVLALSWVWSQGGGRFDTKRVTFRFHIVYLLPVRILAPHFCPQVQCSIRIVKFPSFVKYILSISSVNNV